MLFRKNKADILHQSASVTNHKSVYGVDFKCATNSDPIQGRTFCKEQHMQGSKQLTDYLPIVILTLVITTSILTLSNSMTTIGIHWLQLSIVWLLTLIILENIRREAHLKTDKQRLENSNTELLLAKQAADISNQNKTEFLAAISHEIRTPLNAVLGFSELLLNKRTNSDRHHKLLLIKQSAEHLLHLIEDLLDLARLDAGQVQLQESHFHLREMLDETIASLSPLFANHPVVPIPIFETNTNIEILADATGLRQVLLNLLTNAIKYTPTGQIVLHVDVNHEQLIVQLTDTGIGMTEQQVSQLFEPFVRHHEGEIAEQGTGLGMAITHRLLELMQAQIAIKSEPGQGTAICLKIPISETRERNNAKKLFSKVAVMHSNPTIAQSLECSALSIANTCCCLPCCELESSELDADLLLLEQKLWLTLSCSKQSELTQIIPIVLLQQQDEVEIQATNKVRQLRYPFSLCNLVSQLNYPNSQGTSLTVIEEPLNLSNPILIVDDNPVNLEFMLRLLEGLGIESIAASSGIEAIAHIRKQVFSFIFLDIRMPVMDGIKTRQEILKLDLTATPPIIAVTANAMYGQSQHYRQLGFDDYLSKPVATQDIKTMLTKHSRSTYKCGLNWSKSLLISGNDQQLAKDLLLKLIGVIPELTSKLQNYLSKSCIDEDYIHKILGLVSYTGAELLKEQLAQLEKQLRENPDRHYMELAENVLFESQQVMAQGLNIIKKIPQKHQKMA